MSSNNNHYQTIPHCPFDGSQPFVLPTLGSDGPTLVRCNRTHCILSKTAIRLEDWSRRGAHESRVMFIPSDEPIFIVRAQDTIAPEIVTTWIGLAQRIGVGQTKLQAAAKDEADIWTWRRRNKEKVKVPD